MTELDASVDTHAFDAAVELRATGDGRFTGHTHPAYANMVGPFGGITAATLLRAVQSHPDVLGVPLSLTVNYCGPLADGEFEINARPVRTNRSTQHWSIELLQNGVVATTATAVCGTHRETWSSTEATAPDAPPARDVAAQSFPDFLAWPRNYELRFVQGAIPDQTSGENPDSTTTLWARDTPPRPLDFPALTALCDAFYPRVFLRRGQFMPAGTVSLTIHFHADAGDLAGQSDEYVLGTARAQQFGKGFFDQSAQLWGSNGKLLATSHQLVYFKD